MQLKPLILITVLLFGCLQASSQKAEIRLQDARSREAVAFAHVQLSDFDGTKVETLVSDMEGKISLTLSKPLLIVVSALGYHQLSDTLRPGEQPII